VVIGLMVFKVIPEFADYYNQMGNADLPLSTRIVVAVSTGLASRALIIFPGIAALIAAAYLWVRAPENRKRLHARILQVPYFGQLARRFATAQVSRTLSTLLSGGIPLVNALDISAKAIGNRAISEHLLVVAKEVREGSSLGASLAKRDVFPHIAVEMVEVGESTGALADMLNSVAEFYDEENETSMTRFSNLVQPVLLIVMGAIIAGLLLSLYMPMFQLSSLQNH